MFDSLIEKLTDFISTIYFKTSIIKLFGNQNVQKLLVDSISINDTS